MSWMGLFVWEALTGHKPHLRGFGYFAQISSENSQKNRKNVQLGVRLLAGVLRGMTGGRIFLIKTEILLIFFEDYWKCQVEAPKVD